MDLQVAINGMLKAEADLRSREGVSNPTKMSLAMMTLSSFTSAVEEHLAQYEKDYETQEAQILRRYIIDEGKSATAAEKFVKMELGETEGQIKYLTRLTAAAWRQVGTIQSRYNHLVKEATTQI
jgi:hypothetical protein